MIAHSITDLSGRTWHRLRADNSAWHVEAWVHSESGVLPELLVTDEGDVSFKLEPDLETYILWPCANPKEGSFLVNAEARFDLSAHPGVGRTLMVKVPGRLWHTISRVTIVRQPVVTIGFARPTEKDHA